MAPWAAVPHCWPPANSHTWPRQPAPAAIPEPRGPSFLRCARRLGFEPGRLVTDATPLCARCPPLPPSNPGNGPGRLITQGQAPMTELITEAHRKHGNNKRVLPIVQTPSCSWTQVSSSREHALQSDPCCVGLTSERSHISHNKAPQE